MPVKRKIQFWHEVAMTLNELRDKLSTPNLQDLRRRFLQDMAHNDKGGDGTLEVTRRLIYLNQVDLIDAILKERNAEVA